MWIELFLCLVLAHLVADFVFQTSASCKSKAEKHWRSVHQYLHALIVFALAWLASWDLRFWWGALIIGAAHLVIDIWKSYREDKVSWFVMDQVFHLLVIAGVAYAWTNCHDWSLPFGIELWHVAAAVDGKDTGLYDARINGIYAHGDLMEWYMYWPIFANQITNSQNKLVNDYYYE